jgi:hypothetical protein
MALLKNNISIGWYGGCDKCEDFAFYKENGTLVDGFQNVVGVIQIKDTGYVYSSWSSEKNEKQKNIWANLPQSVRESLDRETFIKDSQGVTYLKCGTPYIIEIDEGSQLDIPDFSISSKTHGDAGRVIECYDCPTFPPCVCE